MTGSLEGVGALEKLGLIQQMQASPGQSPLPAATEPAPESEPVSQEANPFDQFDDPQYDDPEAEQEANPFDQFDDPQYDAPTKAPMDSAQELLSSISEWSQEVGKTTEGQYASHIMQNYIAPILLGAAFAPAIGTAVSAGLAGSMALGAIGALGGSAMKLAAGEETDLVKDVGYGAAFGGMFPIIGQTFTSLFSKIRSISPAMAHEVTALEKKLGIGVTTSDIAPPQGAKGKLARNVRAVSPIVSTAEQLEAQQASRVSMVDQLKNKYGSYSPSSLVDDLSEQYAKTRGEAGSKIGEIKDQMLSASKQPISTPETDHALKKEIHRLKYHTTGVEKKTADHETINKLQNYFDDVAEDSNFANMQQLRTGFRIGVQGERPWGKIPNQSQAAIDNIYKSMTKDLDEAVTTRLGSDVQKQWKKANTTYFEQADKLRNNKMKQALNKGDVTPELVNSLLYSTRPSDVKTLYNSLSPEGIKTGQRGIMQKALERNIDERGVVNPSRFADEMEKMDSQVNLFFKGDEKKVIQGTTRLLGMTRFAQEASSLPKTSFGAYIMNLPGLLLRGQITAGVPILSGAMGHVYESKPARDALIRLATLNKSHPELLNTLERIVNVLPAAIGGKSTDDW